MRCLGRFGQAARLPGGDQTFHKAPGYFKLFRRKRCEPLGSRQVARHWTGIEGKPNRIYAIE